MSDFNGIPFQSPVPYEVVNASPNVDAKYGNYNSVAEALAKIVPSLRAIGRTAGVYTDSTKTNTIEYHFQGGILDSNFVRKTPEVDLSNYDTSEEVDEKIAGIDTSFSVWTEPPITFVATQQTGTQFTLTEMPVKFIITLLNGQDISENFDVQVDNNKVLTLNTQLVIGWEYTLKLTFTFRQQQ